MPKNDRFVRTYTQGTSNHIEIWVDKVTGVNYIYCTENGYCGGMTPLLDAEGKVVLTPLSELKREDDEWRI